MHTIIKRTGLCHTNLSGFLFAFLLSIGIGGCRKEGFTRLMDVELKYKVLPDAERIRLGDTVQIIAWLPYKQFDRFTNSFVDIRDMEVQSWGSVGYMGTDIAINNQNINIGMFKFETFFEMDHTFGTFREYPKNQIIGNMHKNDTAFYFELKLTAKKANVSMIRPGGGRGFMDKGRFRIDIAANTVNNNYHQHLSQKYMPGVTPSTRDYFFEIQ